METIKLDLIPGKKMPSLHASQYDDGREHGIDLFENGVVYKLDGTETLTINERKGDDCICSLDIENTFADSNHIVFASTEQMCAVWGNNICELVIAKGEKTIGTLNFILEIEQSPTEGGIESESEIKNLERQIEAITEEVIGEDYYTAEETDEAIATAIEGKADTTYVNTELAKKADKSNTYTKTETNNLLNAKANASDVYTKSQTDNLLNGKADVSDLPDMTQYYDKSEVDTALNAKADKETTYTKSEVDDIVYNILPDDTASGSVANFTTSLELPIKSLVIDVNAVQESGTPTPSSPKAISGWSEISLVKCGKNLFDNDDFFNFQSWEPNLVTVGELPTNYSNRGYKLPTKVGATYTISFGISAEIFPTYLYLCKTNRVDTSTRIVYITTNSFQRQSYSFTADDSLYYLRMGNTLTEASFNGQIAKISYAQLEVNNQATEYEPYVGNEYIINLGGTYYGGHFTQDKAGHRQFEVTHNIVDLGSLNWVVGATDTQGTYRMQSSDIASLIKKTASSTQIASWVKCEAYQVKDLNSVYLKNMGIAVASSGNVAVYDSNYNTISSSAAFKQSVQGVMFVYELENPIQIIDLPDGEPITTFIGTNNIYADTGDTEVVFKCSVNDYVSAHSGGNLLGMGGVYLGGAKSGGSEEEPTEESEEPKEVTKTLGDEPISKK